jgi:PAS domain-containing protein
MDVLLQEIRKQKPFFVTQSRQGLAPAPTVNGLLYQRGDGTRAWLSFTAAPVLGEDGQIAAGVVTIRDIDEAKLERRKLLELADELKRKLEANV